MNRNPSLALSLRAMFGLLTDPNPDSLPDRTATAGAHGAVIRRGAPPHADATSASAAAPSIPARAPWPAKGAPSAA